MNTSYRDNELVKNKQVLKITCIWAMSSTLAVIILSAITFYTQLHREVHWLPICTGEEFSIGEKAYSPQYLKEMAQKAVDLRLTYNPETIDTRYAMLTHLIPAKFQESFGKQLDAERKAVHEKNISSVFYITKISVDVHSNQAQIEGTLNTTSHNLQLKPLHKKYMLQFSYTNGLLNLKSIQELHNEF